MPQFISTVGSHSAMLLRLFSKDHQRTERDNMDTGSVLYTINNISLTSWSKIINHSFS